MLAAPLPSRLGRYELLAPLARGGMAELFLARVTGVGGFSKLFAIKRILPHLADDADFVQMFLDEGRIMARLSHPNVCQVYENGDAGGELFLVMEYLEGLAWADLVELIPRDDGFALRCAAAVLGQACDGLAYAHELRDVGGAPTPVVHRDVSPQNLMVTPEGVCKLLDFGVSKVLTEGTRTRSGMLKGKLPYMAPEQIRGEPVDARADVFSMGIVLWEALAGERLFKRDSDYLIWRAITEDDIPPVTARRPDLPPAIDAVVGRALERDRARRYPSIRTFASELRHVVDGIGGPLDHAQLAAVVRSLGAARLAEQARRVAEALEGLGDVRDPDRDRRTRAAAAAAIANDPTLEPQTAPSVALRDEIVALGRRRRWPWLTAGALATAGAGVALAVWTHDGGEPAPRPAADVLAATLATRAPRSDARPAPPVEGAGAPADAVAREAEPEPITPEPITPEPITIESILRPASRSRVRRPPRRAATRAAPAERGYYSIDSRPYATIYIDGKSHGATPLFKVALPPGRHVVRAVRSDGRVKRLAIEIEPGKLFSSGMLAW